MELNWQQFKQRYGELRTQFPHLPATPWGVYMGDEPGLLKEASSTGHGRRGSSLLANPERQRWLAAGLELVKRDFADAVTYMNMLYAVLVVCICSSLLPPAAGSFPHSIVLSQILLGILTPFAYSEVAVGDRVWLVKRATHRTAVAQTPQGQPIWRLL